MSSSINSLDNRLAQLLPSSSHAAAAASTPNFESASSHQATDSNAIQISISSFELTDSIALLQEIIEDLGKLQEKLKEPTVKNAFLHLKAQGQTALFGMAGSAQKLLKLPDTAEKAYHLVGTAGNTVAIGATFGTASSIFGLLGAASKVINLFHAKDVKKNNQDALTKFRTLMEKDLAHLQSLTSNSTKMQLAIEEQMKAVLGRLMKVKENCISLKPVSLPERQLSLEDLDLSLNIQYQSLISRAENCKKKIISEQQNVQTLVSEITLTLNIIGEHAKVRSMLLEKVSEEHKILMDIHLLLESKDLSFEKISETISSLKVASLNLLGSLQEIEKISYRIIPLQESLDALTYQSDCCEMLIEGSIKALIESQTEAHAIIRKALSIKAQQADQLNSELEKLKDNFQQEAILRRQQQEIATTQHDKAQIFAEKIHFHTNELANIKKSQTVLEAGLAALEQTKSDKELFDSYIDIFSNRDLIPDNRPLGASGTHFEIKFNSQSTGFARSLYTAITGISLPSYTTGIFVLTLPNQPQLVLKINFSSTQLHPISETDFHLLIDKLAESQMSLPEEVKVCVDELSSIKITRRWGPQYGVINNERDALLRRKLNI